MRHLDLFSGLGGFALAARWVWGDEHELVSFCDNDKAAQIVLNHHWPGVPIHNDIKTLDATKWRGTVDLVTGGFPCQPFSCAGKRRGASDDRYLWPEMLRVIAECQPRWVLAENVPGIVNMELDKVLAGLEGEGYETGTLIVPACAVDAPHIRSRIWIIAYAHGYGTRERYGRDPERGNKAAICGRRDCADSQDEGGNTHNGRQDVADAERVLPQGYTHRQRQVQPRGSCRWLPEPDVGRVASGIPFRVHRLRLLGNAIVPQVAAEIFRAMNQIEREGE